MQRFSLLLSTFLFTILLTLTVFKLDIEQVKSDFGISLEEVEFEDHENQDSKEIEFQLKDLNALQMTNFSSNENGGIVFNYHFAIKSNAQSIHIPPPEG